MKIYWSLRDVPELAPLSWVNRHRVHRACFRTYFWRAPITRKTWPAYVMLFLCPLSLVVVALGVFPDPAMIMLALTVGAPLGYYVCSRMAVVHLRHYYSVYIQPGVEEMNRSNHDI